MIHHKTTLFSTVSIVCCVLSACAGPPHRFHSDADESPFLRDRAILNETNDSTAYRATEHYPGDPAKYFESLQTARALIRSGDCAKAVPRLMEATTQFADDGNVWGMLGTCREKLGDWPGAVVAFESALALGVRPWDLDVDLNPNDMMVRVSGIYAQAGDESNALKWLRRGLQARYDERPDLFDRPEFVSLKDNTEFARLVGRPNEHVDLDRDEQWRRDIAYLRSEVGVLHFDPDHHTSAAELERMLSQLATDVSSLSDEQITARLVRFVGALGAGHDLFWPVGGKRGDLLPFALKVFLFSDGLYIIDAYDPSLVGARIDAFDQVSIADAYAVIAKAFPGDNDMEVRWLGIRHLMDAYTLEALGIVSDATTVTLTVTDNTGGQRTIIPERRVFAAPSPALSAPANVAVPLYLSRLNEPHWMHRLDTVGALYVQINAIADGEKESLEAFANRMIQEAQDPRMRNIILDLRHSGGGNGYLTPPLLRKLIRFDDSPVKDNLYVIIGRNTFSASHNLIVDLDRIANPIFVGEPSGSRPNAIAEAGRIRLPYSRFNVNISSQLHQQSVPEDHRLWIAPDVPVSLSSQEFFAGNDPALDAIQTLITKNAAVGGE